MIDKAGIPDSWILLDSHSTVELFMNKKLLNNIHDMKKELLLHCNAGVTTVEKVGDLPGYGIFLNFPCSDAALSLHCPYVELSPLWDISFSDCITHGS